MTCTPTALKSLQSLLCFLPLVLPLEDAREVLSETMVCCHCHISLPHEDRCKRSATLKEKIHCVQMRK
jgi:hypothetical protein